MSTEKKIKVGRKKNPNRSPMENYSIRLPAAVFDVCTLNRAEVRQVLEDYAREKNQVIID